MILDLLPLLKGWNFSYLDETFTLKKGQSKTYTLPKKGYIRYALISTTSEDTIINFTQITASPKFLNDSGLLYNTRPAALLTTSSPYSILFAPTQVIPYNEGSWIKFQQPITSEDAEISFKIAIIVIEDEEKFKKSLMEIL